MTTQPSHKTPDSLPVVPALLIAKILELKRLETKLGNLPPEQWVVSDLHKHAIANTEESMTLSHETDVLFIEICSELSQLGLKSNIISQTINGQLFYENGPKYCNEAEVDEALSS